MYTLDRYVLSRYLVASLATLIAAAGIFTLAQAIGIIETVALHGRGLLLFGELVALAVPSVLVYVLPTSAFAGCIFVLFHLQEESVLPALYASGAGAPRLLPPTLVLSSLVALITAVFSLYLSPLAERTARDRLLFLSNDLGTYLLKEGQFVGLAEGLTVYVRDVDSQRTMHDLFIYDKSYPDAVTVYAAQRAALEGLDNRPHLSLIEGLAYTVGKDGSQLGVLRFDRFVFDLTEHFPEARSRFPRPSELYAPRLLRMSDEIEDVRRLRRYLAEGHSQLAAPLFAFTLPLIALAGLLAGPTRNGVTLPRVIAASCAGFAFLLSFIGVKSMVIRSLEWIPLMYLLPVVAALVAVVALRFAGSGRQRKPKTSAS